MNSYSPIYSLIWYLHGIIIYPELYENIYMDSNGQQIRSLIIYSCVFITIILNSMNNEILFISREQLKVFCMHIESWPNWQRCASLLKGYAKQIFCLELEDTL